jgi:hypothetical protein
MNSSACPEPPGSQRNSIVHTQRFDCGATARRQPGDFYAVVTPSKMILPGFEAWIEEPHQLSGSRIARPHSSLLE